MLKILTIEIKKKKKKKKKIKKGVNILLHKGVKAIKYVAHSRHESHRHLLN